MKLRWWQWYIVINVGLTCLAYSDRMPGAWVSLLYSIPINLLLWFIPVWVIVLIVIRKKSSTSSAAAEPPSI